MSAGLQPGRGRIAQLVPVEHEVEGARCLLRAARPVRFGGRVLVEEGRDAAAGRGDTGVAAGGETAPAPVKAGRSAGGCWGR
ncbi:hypothetical protein [Streptomyces sp. F63]|uniref:hypothetical protein n=1 Tax=Streptomyces sp. F63 TaxID=2824887 RepID=UPI001FFDE4CC|nr:hypothetical protein [Streptomyces sp. F63]